MECQLDLNADIAKKVDAELERADALRKNGNDTQALDIYINAWKMLPDPKHGWSLYSKGISDGLIFYFLEKGDLDNALLWANNSYMSRPDEIDTSCLIQMGLVHLRRGEFNEAYRWFGLAYSKGKRRAFLEYPKECWNFYSSFQRRQ